MRRSALLRSPTLIEFFRSEDYLHGCKMLLTFEDPAACIQIVKNYLDEGPDCYTKTRLKVHVTLRYKMIDRFVVLVKLYILAQKLALGGLMDIAYENIVEGEQSITPPICFAMTALAYEPEVGVDKSLKDWCLKLVGDHFFALYDMDEWWTEMEYQLDPELGRHWANLVTANGCLINVFEDKVERTWLAGIVNEMAQGGHVGIISIMEEYSYAKDVQHILEEVWAEDNETSDEDGWEDLEQAPDKSRSAKKSAAAINKIGMGMMKRDRSSSLSNFLNDESAKARSVMGMDLKPAQLVSDTRFRFRGGRLLRLLRHC